ncbi:MAG: cupin domain-containing protein [Bacteroidota bacterium]
MEKNEFETGQVFSFADLVNYASGAVVSRTIIKKPTGTVTVFAFDQGEGLSQHTAPFDAMVSIVDGMAEIFIDQKPYRLQAGQNIIMPANVPHALVAVEKFKMVLTMIKTV